MFFEVRPHDLFKQTSCDDQKTFSPGKPVPAIRMIMHSTPSVRADLYRHIYTAHRHMYIHWITLDHVLVLCCFEVCYVTIHHTRFYTPMHTLVQSGNEIEILPLSGVGTLVSSCSSYILMEERAFQQSSFHDIWRLVFFGATSKSPELKRCIY